MNTLSYYNKSFCSGLSIWQKKKINVGKENNGYYLGGWLVNSLNNIFIYLKCSWISLWGEIRNVINRGHWWAKCLLRVRFSKSFSTWIVFGYTVFKPPLVIHLIVLKVPQLYNEKVVTLKWSFLCFCVTFIFFLPLKKVFIIIFKF